MRSLQQYLATHPISVTIVAVFVLFITAWNGIRIFGAVAEWTTLAVFNANPVYIFASGLAWVIAGLALYESLVNGRRFARQAGLILSVLYMTWYWLDRWFMQANPAGNAGFSAVASTVMLVIFNILLYWPSSHAYFTRRQDE